MKRSHSILILSLLVAFVIAALGGLYWINSQEVSGKITQADFLLGWTAGHDWLYKGTSPYDVSVTKEVVAQTSGPNVANTLVTSYYYNTMYALFFYAPFSMIPYELATTLWTTFLDICFIIFILLCIKLSKWRLSALGIAFTILLSIVWLISARSILLGEFTLIPITLMIIGMMLVINKHDVGAGFLLALATAKPDISFLLILYIFFWSIFTHRSKLTTSLVVSFAFLWLLSSLLAPNWIIQWFSVMVHSFEPLHLYHTAISVMAKTLPGVKLPLDIIVHVFLFILLIVAWIKSMQPDNKKFVWTAFLTLAVTALVGFRVDASYPLLVLPGIFLIASVWEQRWKLGGAILGWLFIVVIVGGSWALFLGSGNALNANIPASLYILPPVVVLLGLYWVHWWAVRSPQLPFELLRDHFSI